MYFPNFSQLFHKNILLTLPILVFPSQLFSLSQRDQTCRCSRRYSLPPTIVEAGMSKERIQIKCPAKPITHAFLHFTDSEERDKYIRSANMQKRELRERKIIISPVMDAEERFQQKRMGYVKFCLSKKHEIPLTKITLNRTKKHVSVEGHFVIRTCENGSLKYHKFQNIEKEVENYTDDWLSKNSSRRL